MDGLCGKAMTCNSMTQVKKYITSLERCVLKAPWSGSGRGIMYVSSKEWNDSAEGWVSRVLRVQGEIMVEPLYNKVCDFAMEFYLFEGVDNDRELDPRTVAFTKSPDQV